MIVRFVVTALLVGIAMPLGAAAQNGGIPWDQVRVTELAAQLHEGVKGLRDETRSLSKDLGSGRAFAYYRLMDDLRLIERETRYLHSSLESGAGRDETRPTYRRIALLRRDCNEEMERQYVGGPSLVRISRAREIVRQLNPYYGFDSDENDHRRVLEP